MEAVNGDYRCLAALMESSKIGQKRLQQVSYDAVVAAFAAAIATGTAFSSQWCLPTSNLEEGGAGNTLLLDFD